MLGRMDTKRWGVVAAIGFATAFAPAQSIIPMSGNVETYLRNNIVFPGAGSEGFSPAGQATREAWQDVIDAMLAGNFVTAAALADARLYNLIQFTDTTRGKVYYILKERTSGGQPVNGRGTFMLNPSGRRMLNIQSPHPIVDSETYRQSIAIALDNDALFWQISGTHRCANTSQSGCSGTTKTCSATAQPYRVSDVAHYLLSYYQETSNRVAAGVPELVSISVHGFGPDDAANPDQTSLVQISNGTSGQQGGSLATLLALNFNVLLDPIYGGALAASYQATASDPADVHFVGAPAFSGNTNVQGRWINGETADPCTQNVAFAPLPERFLHMEQQRPLRDEVSGTTLAGIGWQITIDAIANTFEETTWVDFNHPGTEAGSFIWPFDTLAEGVADAGPGGVVRVKPSVSSETTLISTPVTIVAGRV